MNETKKTYPAAECSILNGRAKFSQTADGEITIRLNGSIAANLHRAAETMNGVSWCEKDNTAASLLAYLVTFDTLANWGEQGKHYRYNGLSEELDLIADGIDAGEDADTDEDKRKREELRQALHAAFDVRDLDEAIKDARGE